jgi:hypothetical protein
VADVEEAKPADAIQRPASNAVSDDRTGHAKPRIPDYDDTGVKERWEKIIDRRREELETDVLAIMRPRAKLDPIAEKALEALCTTLIKRDAQKGTAGKASTPDELEREVRANIVERGFASEVKKVTDRLNARRMSDGRRWVLSATYVYLLAPLFAQKRIEDLIKDDLGVAEKIMLDLDAKNGPLDIFASLIVESVMDRNRISKSETLRRIVSQQVRAAI